MLAKTVETLWQWVHNKQAPSPCSVSRLPPLLLCSEASPPGLLWPRHARWKMIARAVLALLRLDRLIVHVHVVLHRLHILVPEQFLKTKGVIAQHQVADRKRMTKDVRADTLARDPCALADPFEEQGNAILGERQARL